MAGADPEGDVGAVYLKDPATQWWDGYNGQLAVIVDELPIELAKILLNKVKYWAHDYPCSLQIKGSTAWSLWTVLIITCQHSIDDFFRGQHQDDVDAVRRRFTEVYVPSRTV